VKSQRTLLATASAVFLALVPIGAAGAADKDPPASHQDPEASQQPVTTPEVHATARFPDAQIQQQVGVSIAAEAGAGINAGDVSYGFGIGGRIGYTMPNRLWIGGHIMYQAGQAATDPTTNYQTANNLWYLGPEIGYAVTAGPVVVRPYASGGVAFIRTSTTGPNIDSSTTDTRPYLAPGAIVYLPIGKFFVGADSRFMVGKEMSALTLYGSAGMKL
jgi:hypothetical protein